MGKHSEVFVAFDVAKKKHAVAIAEGGRRGKSDFLAMSKTVRCRSNARSGDWRIGTTGCRSALKPGRWDTGFIARSRRSATIVWWSLRP